MTRRFILSQTARLAAVAFALGTAVAVAAFADGTELDLEFAKTTAPAEWKKVEPKVRIIQYEFATPKPEGAEADGRLTIMTATGGVKANIDRWYGQFTQPDGKATKDAAKVEEKKVDGLDVHIVDIPGTFAEQVGGPFAGGKVTQRPDYRMLAAIIVGKDAEVYIKLTGPAKTVEAHAAAFKKMVEGLKKKNPAEL